MKEAGNKKKKKKTCTVTSEDKPSTMYSFQRKLQQFHYKDFAVVPLAQQIQAEGTLN